MKDVCKHLSQRMTPYKHQKALGLDREDLVKVLSGNWLTLNVGAKLLTDDRKCCKTAVLICPI